MGYLKYDDIGDLFLGIYANWAAGDSEGDWA